MILHPTIFRMYDIRGRAGEAFDAEGFYVLGRAIVRYLSPLTRGDQGGLKILVSGDGRQSMDELYPALIAGLQDEGAQVVSGGILPTPINLFAFHEGDFDAALQMTASHNPSYDNGLKLVDRKGDISADKLQEIRVICESLMSSSGLTRGSSLDSPIKSENDNNSIRIDEQASFSHYLDKLHSIVPHQKPLKIIVDAGNGVAGPFYPKIFEYFGHTVIPLFTDLDTTFPNHQPDPEEVENMEHCRQAVAEYKADLGVVFDGDGDRLGIVLEDGTILSQDKILYCLAADMLSRHPGGEIIVDAMSSDTLGDKIKNAGGKATRVKTGHSFIKESMEETGALFGGEQSGHFMFGEDFYGHDDAMLAALRFIQAVQSNPGLIVEIKDNWANLIEYSEKFVVDDEKKFDIMDRYVEAMKEKFPEAETVDGIRISFGEGEWAIVRPSNTSPKIAVRIEAKDEKSLEAKKEVLVEDLKALIH